MRSPVRVARGQRSLPHTFLTYSVAIIMALLALKPAFRGGVASAEGDTGTVYVRLHACPTPDSGGLYPDYDTLVTFCDESVVYFNFNLTTEGVTYKGQEVVNGPSTDRIFKDVPKHIFSLEGQISPYDDEPIVYCDTGFVGTEQRMEVFSSDGFTVQPTLGPGGNLYCDWFAVSIPLSAGTNSSATVDHHLCPDGFDLTTADPNSLPASCTGEADGITFDLESYSNYKNPQATGESVPGGVYWQYLKPDFVQITEEQPSDYGTPRVFCRGTIKDGGDYQTAEIPAIGAKHFAYNLMDGEHLVCDWYDVPATAATIAFNVHLCPSDPGLIGTDMSTLAQGCGQSMNGTAISINSDHDDRVGSVGTNGDGMLLWQDVRPGHAVISEFLDGGGYGTPRVFCDSALPGDDTANYTEQPIQSFGFSYDLQSGEGLACDWFNFSDATGGMGALYVSAFACPDGVDAGGSLDTFLASCTQPQDGLALQPITIDGGYVAIKSGMVEPGIVRWHQLPAEGITLVGTPPADYITEAVFCGQALAFDGQPAGYDRIPTYDSNTVHPEIVAGSQEICFWFNQSVGAGNQPVAPEAPDALVVVDPAAEVAPTATVESIEFDSVEDDSTEGVATLYIAVHTCPAGFDATSADPSTLFEFCYEGGNGYDFALSAGDDGYWETSGQFIGEAVSFDNVPSGDVYLQETIPAGYGAPFFVCSGWNGVSGDGSLYLTLPAGTTTSCDWYNTQP